MKYQQWMTSFDAKLEDFLGREIVCYSFPRGKWNLRRSLQVCGVLRYGKEGHIRLLTKTTDWSWSSLKRSSPSRDKSLLMMSLSFAPSSISCQDHLLISVLLRSIRFSKHLRSSISASFSLSSTCCKSSHRKAGMKSPRFTDCRYLFIYITTTT